MNVIIQCVLYLTVLRSGGHPLGRAHGPGSWTEGEPFSPPSSARWNTGVYRILRVDETEQSGGGSAISSPSSPSRFLGLALLIALQMAQAILPLNPQQLGGVFLGPRVSTRPPRFLTNTNWQAYSGETTLSYLTQFLGLTVQNFASPAVGIAVMFALIRGFRQVGGEGLGSFWVDIVRVTLYVPHPASTSSWPSPSRAAGVVQKPQGGPTTPSSSSPSPSSRTERAATPCSTGPEISGDTVTVDGEEVPGAIVVTEQFLPQGPTASQVAIKQTGSNGGGFFGVNSAHPYENPNAFTNLIETTGLLALAVGCCFTFGHRAVGQPPPGAAPSSPRCSSCSSCASPSSRQAEQAATPQLAQGGAVDVGGLRHPGGRQHGGQGGALRHRELVGVDRLHHRRLQRRGELHARFLHATRRA